MSNAEALVDAALAGAGIVCVLEMIVSRQIASGELVPVLTDVRTTAQVPISVIYPQNRHLSPKVRVFVDFVAGLFPRQRA